MKTTRAAVAAACLFASLPALAIDDGSDSSRSNKPQFTFSGLTFSRVETDFGNLKEAINLGFGLGVRIPSIEWIGLELDTSISVIPGENLGARRCRSGGFAPFDVTCPDDVDDPDELQMQIVTLYGVLRSPGQFFGVGKIGYRYMNTSIEELEERDGRSGTAWVLGAGYRYNERGGTVELLYTNISDSMSAIGLSISY